MDTTRQMINFKELDVLKRDAQLMQKKGLPFMMASVVIWTLILSVRLMHFEITRANLYTFMCSCFLMPLAFLFSKILKADIFKKTANPINKLGFLCTMNQMLYLVIVMWAFSREPEAMLMLYACVFGAHLLPYSWVYDNRAYAVTAVVETIGALIISMVWGSEATAVFMIIMQVLLCVLLFIDIRKAKTEVEG